MIFCFFGNLAVYSGFLTLLIPLDNEPYFQLIKYTDPLETTDYRWR